MTDPAQKMVALPFEIEFALSVEDDRWRDLVPDLEACSRETVEATLQFLGGDPAPNVAPRPVVEVSLLLTDDAAIRKLNREYRQKDMPTNVLSFPDTLINPESLADAARMNEPLILGDVIMASDTIIREAGEQGKKITDHYRHLLVHGVLHLAGHDHIEQYEALIMEQLEVNILRSLGVPDPYETRDWQS